jgi:hypothetical protein
LSKNAVKLKNWEKLNTSNPLFYVNISNDTDTLHEEVFLQSDSIRHR